MATILTGNLTGNLTVDSNNRVTTGCSVSKYGNFIFFSNCPETVTTAHLGDSGKWLGKIAGCSNYGMIYSWHKNTTGKTILSFIRVRNTGATSITVRFRSAGWGTNKLNPAGDAEAWKAYFSNTAMSSITIAAGKENDLFAQTVANNACFGIVSPIEISGGTAEISEIAHSGVLPALSAYAAKEAGFIRGKGGSYRLTLKIENLVLTDTIKQAGATIGANSSNSFKGLDVISLSDPGAASGDNVGDYGMHLVVELTVTNSSSNSISPIVILGSRGGLLHTAVKLGASVVTCTNIAAYKYVEVISIGSLAKNASGTVIFNTCVAAMSSTPVVIGVKY